VKISEQIEVPVELSRLMTIVAEFARVASNAEAEVTFRRVGRGTSPLEVVCEWEAYASEADEDSDEESEG